MTTMSADRLTFMRDLGISEEDVMDPSILTGVDDEKKPSSKFVGKKPVSEASKRASGTVPRTVFLDTGATNQKPPHTTVNGSFQTKNLPKTSAPPSSRLSGSPEKLKSEGNRAFEEGRYREALSCYTGAIEFILNSGNVILKEQQARGCKNIMPQPKKDDPMTQLLAALFSNRSACYLQASKQIGSAEALESALRDADRAVELRPTWFKGYSRQGDAYFKMKRYAQAAEAYEMALQFDPSNNNLMQSIQEARQRIMMDVREGIHAAKKMPPCTHTNAAFNNGGKAAMRGQPNINETQYVDQLDSTQEMKNGSRVTARELWNQFKHEVEATVQQPTGDDYRLEQLRLYREQKEREKNTVVPKSFKDVRKEPTKRMPEKEDISVVEPRTTNAQNLKKDGQNPVLEEFTSAAAAAYQQRLLEEFRRKKAHQN